MQVVSKRRKEIDRALKPTFTGRQERDVAHEQVRRLVGDGSSVDDAIAAVIRWRNETEGVSREA